ncbi:MAG: electron transfer flavoprotein subunit alpha/FixB family protein [Acidimicrobiales bacterium]
MSVALVLAEHDEDGLIDSSLRALGFARGLGDEVVVCVFGTPPAGAASQASDCGAQRAFVVAAKGYAPLSWARALGGLGSLLEAQAIVAAGTDRGNEVMAHLGAITGEEMVANCLAAEQVEPATWRLTRQRWGGSLLEEARLEATRALLTVATDALVPASLAEPGSSAVLESYEPQLTEGDEAVRATESRQQSGGVSLASARVVVSGGRGVGGPEGFAVIEELAGLLGGAVGVSRVVTSLGWRPHREQVGQTGTRVAPDLYLACGISGAIQHLAGCQSAKTMIAINTDSEAPIMSRADHAVIGDLGEVLPLLVEALRTRKP